MFSYKELALATNNFSENRKLGEGRVYRGTTLSINNNTKDFENFVVKKICRDDGDEFVTEVTKLSRLIRHPNLVKLIGWCHEKEEVLLVYEYMPNGSLHSYLFNKNKPSLSWKARHKIARQLASAVLHLHEGCHDQSAVHGNINSSNVMLDSDFNAKLGYLAPERVTTGSKESDVYGFGEMILEVVCWRKAVDVTAGEGKGRLAEWVWDLYGRGRLMEAADERLVMVQGKDTFQEGEMVRLMTVGLCCLHPDEKSRPSMKQVVKLLNGEAELPRLPAKMPWPQI